MLPLHPKELQDQIASQPPASVEQFGFEPGDDRPTEETVTESVDSSSTPSNTLNFVSPESISSSAASSSSSSFPSTDHDTQIRERDDKILFMKRTNEGLLAEIKELQEYAQYFNAVHSELQKVHSDLEKAYNKLQFVAEKDSSNLNSKLNDMQSKLDELSAAKGKFVQNQAKSRKAYHDLGPAQKSVIHKDVRENLVPELDSAFKKRKLEVSEVVLVDSEGKNAAVKIHARPRHTFDELNPAELEIVSAISDLKVIYRTSHAAYAANRRLIKDFPPLEHLKLDEALLATMPQITVAPGRPGGFTPIRSEIKAQIEYLDQKGDLNLAEPVIVKCGIDATKMTHNDNACVYSVETISSATEIGLVGAVKGGDSAKDMAACGPPYFEALKELDANPSIETNVGAVNVKLRGGGDLSNIYEQLGLCKATSRYCCPICVLPKDLFYRAAFDPEMVKHCNGRELGRTRANIMNEAVKSKPEYSVKRLPQCPLPRDPNMLIIDWIVFCVLHAYLRGVGNS